MQEYEVSLKKAMIWTREPFDEKTREEVQLLIDQNKRGEIIDRFFGEMEFGTAGLRGIIGAGTTRMNIYTVARATQGLADCLNTLYKEAGEKGVVVGYDCRHFSREFAQKTAGVLARNNIKVYLYRQMTPTQLVPFAIRRLKGFAGIMITSSHNPAQYNGYKVYWSSGAQITSPVDREILSFIQKVTDYNVAALPIAEGVQKGLIYMLGQEVVQEYIQWARETAVRREISPELRVVYTPLHGVGFSFAREVFERSGFKHFFVVEEQKEPDGDFPTVKAPNPEIGGAMEKALFLAREKGADIVLATDGDADRVGVAIKRQGKDYLSLTGNQAGALCTYYLLSRLKEENRLTGKEVVISTVVSLSLIHI